MRNRTLNVAILIVSHNGRGFLPDCLEALHADRYAGIRQRIYVVDNASTDGTQDYIRTNWPQVRLIESEHNLGFAAGNNLGWQTIVQDDFDAQYLCLLNQDTIPDQSFLEPLVAHLEQHADVGSVQPLLLLHPDRDKINSLGNIIHFLGFGYSSYNGHALASRHLSVRDINYASGAALVVRRTALDAVGLFDDFMFMYLEDLDLGWRLLASGYRNRLVPTSIVYHQYEFARGMRQYYYFERNRLWIVLKNYRLATLLVILPALLWMEVGQLLFAARNRVLGLKLKSYAFFFKVSTLVKLLRDRRSFARMRAISDRALLARFSGRIDFQPVQTGILKYLVNPAFEAYRRIIRYCMVW